MQAFWLENGSPGVSPGANARHPPNRQDLTTGLALDPSPRPVEEALAGTVNMVSAAAAAARAVPALSRNRRVLGILVLCS